MSFNSSFGGFIVIHAPLLSPERKAHFERELHRVKIDAYTVMRKSPGADDPRLAHYASDRDPASELYSKRMLSLIDNFLAAIDTAQASGWSRS